MLRDRTRWILIFLIFVISAVAYLDRVNISIAGRAIANEFHLSNQQLGWIFSAFVLGYAFAQAPAGRLADRIGPRLILLLGVFWWAVFTTLITTLSSSIALVLPLLIAIRFLLGVGEAVVYPASNCVVASWIPSSERGIANGFIFSGVGFGAGVTPPLITYVMSHYGWRAAFWCSSALGIVIGLIWYAVARNSPQQHPGVSEREREYIEHGKPEDSSKAAGIEKAEWRSIFLNRDILMVTFSYFAYGYAAYIFFSWFFIYLSDVRHLDLKQSSFYTMLPFMAMAIGSPLGGWISDRLTKAAGKRVGRCVLACVGMAFSALFIALSAQVASAQVASLMLAGGAGALYISQSSFWSVTADVGGRSAGSVSGVMNMGGQFGGALTASLTPWIADRFHSWPPSFLTAAGLCALGALAWLFVNPDAKLASRAQALLGPESVTTPSERA
ncbi:MAG: MFS transporter [Acidobacteriaceae bacterium]|nr:MFS transporter [Acidobacteriaceae bacterium]